MSCSILFAVFPDVPRDQMICKSKLDADNKFGLLKHDYRGRPLFKYETSWVMMVGLAHWLNDGWA